MAKKVEYAADFKGYTPYSGMIHEQDLGFAKVRRIRQFEDSNPFAGRNKSLSPSWVGELINPHQNNHRSNGGSKQNNEIAIAWGSAVHQAIKTYHLYRGEYTKETLPPNTRKRRPKNTEPKPSIEKDDRVRLVENLEKLSKYAPELLLEFRQALKRYHQYHLSYSPRSLTRIEESFVLEIRLGDKLPPQFRSTKPVSAAVRELFSDDPEYLAKLNAHDSKQEANSEDQKQLVALHSGLGLKVIKVNGKYDQVVEEDLEEGFLPQAIIPIDLKSQYHSGNSNDLLQLSIQWLSLLPHRVDCLSLSNIPDFRGRFYTTKAGEIFEITSTNPLLTAFYTVQELAWADLATKLDREKNRREGKYPNLSDDLFGLELPPIEFVIGSRRFDLKGCIEQARTCQKLADSLLKEERIGQVASRVEPLADEVIDKIIADAQRFTTRWRIDHKQERLEKGLVVMAAQDGMIDDLVGQKGKESWVAKTAWGRSPQPPPLPEPEPNLVGQYRLEGI